MVKGRQDLGRKAVVQNRVAGGKRAGKGTENHRGGGKLDSAVDGVIKGKKTYG